MKNTFAIIGAFSICFILYILYLNSPVTPSNRNSPPKELNIVGILSDRKGFADQIIKDYSNLPRDNTQEVRRLYKSAQIKFNTIIELFGYGADNRLIPIDIISQKIPEAEIAYKQLHNYITPPEQKQSIDQQTIKSEWLGSIHPMAKLGKGIGKEDSVAIPEAGALARALNEIVGQKEIYEKIAQRIEKYRWEPFPEK